MNAVKLFERVAARAARTTDPSGKPSGTPARAYSFPPTATQFIEGLDKKKGFMKFHGGPGSSYISSNSSCIAARKPMLTFSLRSRRNLVDGCKCQQ
jgi:hypothetical protein